MLLRKSVICTVSMVAAATVGAIVWWTAAFPRFGPADVAKVQSGLSQAEVIAILGEPHRKLDNKMWRYLDRPGWGMILDVQFDDGGKVVHKEYHD